MLAQFLQTVYQLNALLSTQDVSQLLQAMGMRRVELCNDGAPARCQVDHTNSPIGMAVHPRNQTSLEQPGDRHTNGTRRQEHFRANHIHGHGPFMKQCFKHPEVRVSQFAVPQMAKALVFDCVKGLHQYEPDMDATDVRLAVRPVLNLFHSIDINIIDTKETRCKLALTVLST